MSKHMPVLLAAGLVVLLSHSPLRAQGPGCASCGSCAHQPKVPCPPPFCHYAEGPPNLKFKKACPRPVCDPCNLEHFGYYQTCWAPWPYQANYDHCPVPHSGTVLPPPLVPPYTPRVPRPAPGAGSRPAGPDYDVEPMPRKQPDTTLPPPKKFDDKEDDKPAVRLLLPRG